MAYVLIAGAVLNGLYALLAFIGWVIGDAPDEADRRTAIIASLILAVACLDKALA